MRRYSGQVLFNLVWNLFGYLFYGQIFPGKKLYSSAMKIRDVYFREKKKESGFSALVLAQSD